MKLFVWTMGALISIIVGIHFAGVMLIAFVCLCGGVYELWKRDNVEPLVERRDKYCVWVNGAVMNSGLTEEEADVMADAYLKAGFFDVETGLEGK